MDRQPDWFVQATDLALGIAGAQAIGKLRSFDFIDSNKFSPEVLWHFKCYRDGHRSRNYQSHNLGEDGIQESLRVLNRIACSPNRVNVWRALERFGTPHPEFVVRLCREIGYALDEFDKVAITTKELKEAAARIRTLSLKLADELANPGVRGSLDRVWREVVLRRRTVMDSRQAFGSYPKIRELLFLADAATLAPSLPKVVGQPNSPGARRLHFIRHVTQWLNAQVGTPMRSQVLELTGVFFETDDLTPQMLATLAPVRKQRDRVPVY